MEENKKIPKKLIVKIESLNKFIKKICNIKYDINDKDIRNVLLFRGQSDIEYKITPSIVRYNKNKNFCYYERNLIEMAKFKLPNIFTNDLQPIELLSLLQHYGIPTRLLDVTENALVALYFACQPNFDEDKKIYKDGEVIVFLSKESHIANSPLINGIADSYRFLENGSSSINSFYKKVKEQPYFLEQKNLQTGVLNEEQWINECLKNVFFIYAPFKIFRQQIQCGRYILFSNSITNLKTEEKEFDSKIKPLSKKHDCIKMRIRIPADNKTKILNDLKMFGISKGILFGDSVDKVCEDIKELLKS